MLVWGGFLLGFAAVRVAVEGHPEMKRRVMPFVGGLLLIGIGAHGLRVTSRQANSTGVARAPRIFAILAALFALGILILGLMLMVGVLPRDD